MFKAQSLALYKNRPVLVLEVRDRIEIKLEDGSSLRVRDKDLTSLHPGPAAKMPEPASGGDFETARAMLAGGEGPAAPAGWMELAELVFGASGPAEVLACWKEASEGRLYRVVEGLPQALSEAEVAREAQKRSKKEGEAAERAAFVERARRARGGAKKSLAAPPASGAEAVSAFLPEDERFLAEIEALAYGKSAKNKLAGEIGFEESPEAAAAFLLATGRWSDAVNPYPARAGCSLAAPRLELGPDIEDGVERVELFGMLSWAIDNAWSADPDDAIAWDGTAVWVQVADPAASILPDSPADREALSRGATLYLPELIAPMLPDEALSRFGLGLGAAGAPGEAPSSPGGILPSPALSFRIEVAEDGSIASAEVVASRVRVRRASYAEADRLMEAGEAPELEALAGIARLRAARRAANGAVEIDIPEMRVRVSDDPAGGKAISLLQVPADRSSGLVREMMLLAGEAAARWAFERELAFPFYSQEAPGEAGAAAAGAGLSAQFARRRLMRAGISGPSPQAHRGLGLPFYAQATSPLRRYQDLLGHMQIRAVLAGRRPLDADEVGRRCAQAQAAAAACRQAERDSDLHWKLAWLGRNPDWEGDAILVGTASGGAWQAFIPELGLETRLKLGPDRELDQAIRVRASRIGLAALESSFEEVR